MPGVDLDGVVKSIDCLLNVNLGYRVKEAFDSARAAIRSAALSTGRDS